MRQIGLCAVLGAGLLWSTAASAAIVYSVQSTNAVAGSTGNVFEVDLQNTGPTAVDLSAFSFRITTTDTNVTFNESTTQTSFSYIFTGDSFVDTLDPVGHVNSTSTPGQVLQASDVTFSGSNVTVAANSTVGLGLVMFDVGVGDMPGPVLLSFDTDTPGGNSLADMSFSDIPITGFQSGTITVSASQVPEPATSLMLLAGGLLLAWRRLARP